MADYHSLLMRAVANLPNAGTPATRGALYERARKALTRAAQKLASAAAGKRHHARREGARRRDRRDRGKIQAAGPGSAPCFASPGGVNRASPAARKPDQPPAKSGPAAPCAQNPVPVQRPSAPAALRAGPLPPARSPSQTGSPVQPGIASPPVQRQRSDLRRRRRSGASQPGARRKRQLRLREASRNGPDGGFASSIPAGCRDGQPALPGLEAAIRSTRGRGKNEGMPGVAALDPGRAFRPNKADDAQDVRRAAGRRVPSRSAAQWAEAPEIAAEFDRPAFRVEAGGGDSAPRCARRRSRQAETPAVDRSRCCTRHHPCGGGSRNSDASEAAGSRHQASGRGATTRSAGAFGEDR